MQLKLKGETKAKARAQQRKKKAVRVCVRERAAAIRAGGWALTNGSGEAGETVGVQAQVPQGAAVAKTLRQGLQSIARQV